MSILTSTKQVFEVVTNRDPVIGEIIRLTRSAGGGHAYLLFVCGDKAHVTGINTDGTRWYDFVTRDQVRLAVLAKANALELEFEAAGELDNVARELAYNIEHLKWIEERENANKARRSEQGATDGAGGG